MAKIRGVKPDYWTDEDIVELSMPARLLFIGMWNYCCDNGHLQDKSKQIKMRVLPTDDVNVAELLRELEKSRIRRSDGWITIPKFTEHQKPDKRYFQTCSKPGCNRPGEVSTPETRSGNHETTPGTPRALAVVSMGTPGDGDGDGDGDVSIAPRAPMETEPDGFEKFWDAYDKKRGRKTAMAKYRLALKKPNVTAELLIHAANEYVEWLRREGKHPEFTKDPTTWLNGEHWNDERMPSSAKPKHDPDWALR